HALALRPGGISFLLLEIIKRTTISALIRRRLSRGKFQFPLPPMPDPSKITAAKSPLLLVADDDPLLRSLAERVLTQAGYRVMTTADGAECVARFRELGSQVNLVLLDNSMPRMTG